MSEEFEFVPLSGIKAKVARGGKHTPGPWHCTFKNGWTAIGAPGITGYVAETACRGEESYLPEEVERSNARLIAAAPDLLAACEDVEQWFSAKVRADVLKANVELDRLRAAIAKAKGGAV